MDGVTDDSCDSYFLRVFIFLVFYITIYILISYIVYKEDVTPHFLIVTTVICHTWSFLPTDSFFY